MATRDNGRAELQKNSLQAEKTEYQCGESRAQMSNSQRNEDVKYSPTVIYTNQFSKSFKSPLSSTGFGGKSMTSTIGSTHQAQRPHKSTEDGLQSKSLFAKTSVETGKSSLNSGLRGFTEEKLIMKRVFYRFSSEMEESLKHKHSAVLVKFERNGYNAVCILKGVSNDVQDAKATLHDMENTLHEAKMIFPTKTSSALKELSIEDIVSDLLKDKYPSCVAQQLKNEIFLYGFDKGVVENAKKFLSKAILGNDFLLFGRLRENKTLVLNYFKSKYKSRMVVCANDMWGLHMVGQKEAVQEASTEYLDINEGRKSMPEGTVSNLHQEVTKVFGPLEPVHFRFLNKPVKLTQVSDQDKVTVCSQEVNNTITINGPQENVTRAAESLHLIGTSIITDRIDIVRPNAFTFFESAAGDQEVDSCMKIYDVLLEKKVIFACGKLQVTKELHNDISTWSTSEGKLLTVGYFDFKSLKVDLKFVMTKIDPNKGGNFKATGNTVRMAVPDMVNRGQTDDNTIGTILNRALEKAGNSNAKLVAFLISPVANWDFDSLMQCTVKSFVDWLLKFPKKDHYSVMLCVEEKGYFFRTDDCIGIRLRTKIEDMGIVNKQPKISIVKGRLDKAVADVIVNTAACNLDLSFGNVSRALLKAAGPELQNECWKYHSNGIKHDDIAVTGGYNLKCKAVFHITLQSQDRSTQGYIESIRSAMSLCLKSAADYSYRSIAFPAMGTGSLRYPPKEAASEMIMAVERFTSQCSKNSIEEVQFVIFPNDETLLQTFQKMAEKLVKPTVQFSVQFDITGLHRNVKDGKLWLTSRGDAVTTNMASYGTESTDSASARSGLTRKYSEPKHLESGQQYLSGNTTIRVYVGDILNVSVDCIVNAANGDLDHCGGIAHVIAEAAGKSLYQECATLIKERGRLPVTSVVRTSAGNLSHCKCVLHAVGPDYTDYTPFTKSNLDKCEHDLYQTIRSCLIQASDMKLKYIALPTISSGLFRVPKEVCAIQYAQAVKDFSASRSSLREIHFVDKNRDMIEIVHKTFDAIITQGKPAPFDTTKLVELTTTVGVEARGEKEAFKSTARDRPKALSNDCNAERVPTHVNACYKSNSMKLTCKFGADVTLEVQIYESDIVNLRDIDSVVCSENRAGNAKGIVARLLLEKGGEEYKVDKVSKFKCRPNFGEIITTRGGKNSYTWIIHAIISRKDPNAIPLMYSQIFQEVEEKGFTSVSIPLLGTGVGDVDPRSCSEMLFGEVIQFCQTNRKHKLTLHVVINDKPIADIVKGVFVSGIDEIGKKPYADTNTKLRDSQHFEGTTAPTEKGTAVSHEEEEGEADCVICMDTVTGAKTLPCGHMFCEECIEGYFRVKKVCPTCGKVCGTITGDQPDGTMIISKQVSSVSGFEKHNTIVITYCFSDGTQGPDHPRPGEYYKGIRRTAYLSDNTEGRRICAMLKVAFERRLVFTIGTSRTTGKECVITWNDIHHKTDMRPNTQFGYPDETYLQRVREELEVKGVTVQDTEAGLIKDLKDDNFKKTFTAYTK